MCGVAGFTRYGTAGLRQLGGEAGEGRPYARITQLADDSYILEFRHMDF